LKPANYAAKAILEKYTPSLQGEYSAFAPANIALCKYWGKRDVALNLPVNDSLSVSLKNKGTHTTLKTLPATATDSVILNDLPITPDSPAYQKIVTHIDLFRTVFGPQPFAVKTTNTVPTAAGVASSASGFAALTTALTGIYSLPLTAQELSVLARLGSGSACRSVFNGFVRWYQGSAVDGSDSYAALLPQQWSTLRIGLLTLTHQQKNISSREGMLRTTETSHLYRQWSVQVAEDILQLEQAISQQDFELLGRTAEHNAMSMHATMLSAWPPLCYWIPDSIAVLHQVWSLRKEGLDIYATMDAGPNIKLLFEQQDEKKIRQFFPSAEICCLF